MSVNLHSKGRGNRDGGMSVNFNYDKVLIKLQTKRNTNWQIMIMFALESILQPSSSPSPQPQFFYALMSNNAKHPVICLLMVCITVSQEWNAKWSDMSLKSWLLHRYKCVGQNVNWRYPLILTDSLHDPLACKNLILIISWYSMPQGMLFTMFQKFFQICSQLHFFYYHTPLLCINLQTLKYTWSRLSILIYLFWNSEIYLKCLNLSI